MNFLKKGTFFCAILASGVLHKTSAQFGPGMGLKTDCKPAASYKFDGDMKMRAATKMKESDTIVMDIQALVSNTGNYMGMVMNGLPGAEGSNMQMVIDLKDSIAYMLMSLGGKSKGMCMDMNAQRLAAQKAKMAGDSSFDFTKYKKTGNTRKILGYTCHELRYEDKKKTQCFWITEEVGDFYQAYNKAWGTSSSGVQLPEGFKGMLLAMNMVDKENDMTMNMEVIEHNKNKPSEISTAGYFED